MKKLIRKSEKTYHEHKFDLIKNNMKETWNLINCIIKRKTISHKTSQSFNISNKKVSNPAEIAQSFNNFFSNIGSTLANKIPKSNKDHIHYLNKINKEFTRSLFLSDISEDDIIKIINGLRNCSAGPDLIKPMTLQKGVLPLLHIYQLSFQNGIFPDELKLAKVVPIFKKEDESKLTNYRPISLLSVFSKILERLMANRLVDFIEKYSILSEEQFGFRKGRSTYMAVINFLKKVQSSIENKEHCIGIYIDLSKAFDTVNHEILLDKLRHYGIRGTVHSWFKSYLSNRKQFTCYNDNSSDLCTINCGVPQGSILGPILFILYINDIIQSSDILNFTIFADDTNILASHKDVNTLTTTMNHELIHLDDWLRANRLSLNLEKTKCMFFHNSKIKINNQPRLYIRNHKIDCVRHTNFLGLIIDETLTWREHIKHIKLKISRVTGILYKVRDKLNFNALKSIYYSLVQSNINYCLLIWGSSAKNDMDSIFKIQKRYIKMATYNDWRTPSEPLFKKFKLLKLKDLFKLSVAKFVWNCLKMTERISKKYF